MITMMKAVKVTKAIIIVAKTAFVVAIGLTDIIDRLYIQIQKSKILK